MQNGSSNIWKILNFKWSPFFFILLFTIYNLGYLNKTRKIHSKCRDLKYLYLLFWTNKTFVKRSFVTAQIVNSNYEIKFNLTSRFLAPKYNKSLQYKDKFSLTAPFGEIPIVIYAKYRLRNYHPSLTNVIFSN